MINTEVIKIRKLHIQKSFMDIEEVDCLSLEDLKCCVTDLMNAGLNEKIIKQKFLPDLGFEVNSLPDEINDMLIKGK